MGLTELFHLRHSFPNVQGFFSLCLSPSTRLDCEHLEEILISMSPVLFNSWYVMLNKYLLNESRRSREHPDAYIKTLELIYDRTA